MFVNNSRQDTSGWQNVSGFHWSEVIQPANVNIVTSLKTLLIWRWNDDENAKYNIYIMRRPIATRKKIIIHSSHLLSFLDLGRVGSLAVPSENASAFATRKNVLWRMANCRIGVQGGLQHGWNGQNHACMHCFSISVTYDYMLTANTSQGGETSRMLAERLLPQLLLTYPTRHRSVRPHDTEQHFFFFLFGFTEGRCEEKNSVKHNI